MQVQNVLGIVNSYLKCNKPFNRVKQLEAVDTIHFSGDSKQFKPPIIIYEDGLISRKVFQKILSEKGYDTYLIPEKLDSLGTLYTGKGIQDTVEANKQPVLERIPLVMV